VGVAVTACEYCGHDPAPRLYQDSFLSLDFYRREVRVKGKLVALTPIEFALLVQFVGHRGNVLSITHLLDHVWGPRYRDTPDLPKWHISNLRRKLGDSAGEHIVTVRGFGYKYEPPKE
jgi:DNA-binding response OmpR family regulator